MQSFWTLWPYLGLALLVGVLLPVQSAVNAQLGRLLANPLLAALCSFTVGTVVLLVVALIARFPLAEPFQLAPKAPAWIWLGGVFGSIFVASAIIAAPRLGATTLAAFIIGGQLLAGLIIDHWGLLGYSPHPASFLRLFGAGLLMVALCLIHRF